MRKTPLISRRLSLRFLPEKPDEPTNTLVLNAGGTGAFYCDFRPLSAAPEDCEWAFGGAKEYLEDGRCRWTHLVDSREGKEGGKDGAPDVGLCETLEDGTELESGEMINPRTGQVGKYEEVWKDVAVPTGSRVILAVLRRSGQTTIDGIWIQVGGLCQSVARGHHGDVAAVRWQYDDSKKAWSQTARYGQIDWIPTPGTSPASSDEPARSGWVIEEDYVV